MLFANQKVQKYCCALLLLLLCLAAICAFAEGLDEAATSCTVEFYAAIDNSWVRVDMQTGNLPVTSDGRFYITASELENVYSEYGFTAAQYNGEHFFPHTDYMDTANIWADAAPFQQNGQWCIPLAKRRRIFIYYMPYNIPENPAYVTSKCVVTDPAVLASNSFYTVMVSDPDRLTQIGTQKRYVRSGLPMTQTLPKLPNGREWVVLDYSNTREMTEQTDYTVTDSGDQKTYAIASLKNSVKFTTATPNRSYSIQYNAATLNDSLELLGVISAGQQKAQEEGAILNQPTVREIWEPTEAQYYTLLSPDQDYLLASVVGSSQGKKCYYSFRGWRLGDSHRVLPAGTQLSAADIQTYEQDGLLTLNAVWSGADANTRVKTANFYVNLKCEIQDNKSEGYIDQPMEDFTKVVYTVPVEGTDGLPVTQDMSINQFIVAQDASSAYQVDAQIRNLATEPYQGVRWVFFPTDEEVFESIRAQGAEIQIDGVTIPVERLTTDHFKIRWYVTKYHKDDGWHVDGILVAKRAYLKVTTTFGGNDDAIDLVKNQDYSITVQHMGDNGQPEVDFLLSLNPADAQAADHESRSGYTGYTSYDAQTRTYTWILAGHPIRTYQLLENNHHLANDTWHNVFQYRIINGIGTAPGWQAYDDDTGVSVMVESYPDDVPDSAYRRVAFQNLYSTMGTFTLSKADAFCGDPIANVTFELHPADRSVMRLFQKPGTSEYTSDEDSAAREYTILVADNRIQTDASGKIYLKLSEGSYTLTELTPSGYYSPKKIVFTVDGDGKITEYKAYDNQSADVTADYLALPENTLLRIENRSRALTTVTARADWDSKTPQAERKPVVVQLWCNGKRLTDANGQGYTQTLSQDNNWTCVWQDLPLYMDGFAAQYALRETKIGETSYDGDLGEGGYKDYIVQMDPLRYREGESGDYDQTTASWTDASGVIHYAHHVLLAVHNSLRTEDVTVDISGVKTWKNDQPENRPEFITIQLLADGDVKRNEEIRPNAAGEWKWTFENLPKFGADDVEIKYAIREMPVANYEATVIGYNIINVYRPGSTATPEPSVTPTPGVSPTPTAAPTPTPTATPTSTPTATPTPTVSPTPVPDAPKTGDQQPLGMWFALVLMSGAGIVWLLYRRYRKS